MDEVKLPLPADVWETLPPVAQALIVGLQAQVAALEVRLQELEARLAQNSTNSSRPPSSDPPPSAAPRAGWPQRTAAGWSAGA